MRFIISNLVSANGGDSAINIGTVNALKAAFGADTQFIMGDSNPQVTALLYPDFNYVKTLGIQAVSIRSIRYIGRYIRKAKIKRYMVAAGMLSRGEILPEMLIGKQALQTMKLYKCSQAIISCGGTYLREDYGIASQLAEYELALALGKPLIFYTQSIGAFTGPANRKALKQVFNRSAVIFVRDEESQRNLIDLGVDSAKIQIRADAAFALADPDILHAAKSRRLPADRPLRVAISVRKWEHFKGKNSADGNDKYAKAIAKAVIWLVSSLNAQVVFLSTCQGISEYDDDSIFAAEIFGKLDLEVKGNVDVTTNRMSHNELISKLSEFDFNIGTRMHMCILSLLAGTPVLPIAYEFKTKELFNKLGQCDMVLEMEHISGDSLISGIQQYLDKVDSQRNDLFDAVECEYENAMETGVILSEILKGCG